MPVHRCQVWPQIGHDEDIEDIEGDKDQSRHESAHEHLACADRWHIELARHQQVTCHGLVKGPPGGVGFVDGGGELVDQDQ